MIRRSSKTGLISKEFKWNGDEVIKMSYNIENKSIVEVGLKVVGQAVLLCPVDVGRLRKSIILKTNEQTFYNKSGKPEDGTDEISKPLKPLEGYVGTAVDYAPYKEFGSGPHKTDDRSEDFIKNMEEWAHHVGIENPWPIIQYIRKHGTEPKPFLRPAFDLIKGESLVIHESNGKKEFDKYKSEWEGKFSK